MATVRTTNKHQLSCSHLLPVEPVSRGGPRLRGWWIQTPPPGTGLPLGASPKCLAEHSPVGLDRRVAAPPSPDPQLPPTVTWGRGDPAWQTRGPQNGSRPRASGLQLKPSALCRWGLWVSLTNDGHHGDSGGGDLGDLVRPADLDSESLVDSGSFSSAPASEQGVLLSGIQTLSPGGTAGGCKGPGLSLKPSGRPLRVNVGPDRAWGPEQPPADEVCLSGDPSGQDGPQGKPHRDCLAACPAGKWPGRPCPRALLVAAPMWPCPSRAMSLSACLCSSHAVVTRHCPHLHQALQGKALTSPPPEAVAGLRAPLTQLYGLCGGAQPSAPVPSSTP